MYLKYTADRIFNGFDFLPDDSVVVTDQTGKISDIVSKQDAGEDIRYVQGLLMPGLVNAHLHLELSHLKGKIQEETGLVPFLQSVVSMRAGDQLEKEDAMRQAIQTMRDEGIVAAGDICNTTDSISVKLNSDIHWHHFIEVYGFQPENAGDRMRSAISVQNDFCKYFLKDNVSVVPHAPYSVSDALLGLINQQSEGQLISIHHQETDAEDQLFLEKSGAFIDFYRKMGIHIDFFKPTGKSSTASWLPKFNRSQKLLLVHNTCSKKADFDFEKQHVQLHHISELYHVFCPAANHYIERKIPPVDLFWSLGAQCLLGTDSLASNDSLSIWKELSLVRKHFPQVPEREILQWVSSGGARALGFDQILGQLTRGYRPGLVQVSEEKAKRIN